MHINCLRSQEGMFETRLLRRAFELVYLDPDLLTTNLDGPLVLYGQWHPFGFWEGVRWLADFVFQLQHPCIVLPPFSTGSVSDALGLVNQVHVRATNANLLTVLPEAEPLLSLEKQTLQVQTDFAFSGSAGKPWLSVRDEPLAALLMIQPKNTVTPLLLCGMRLLSASGLSNDQDRLNLLDRIITWSWGWQPVSDPHQLVTPSLAKLDPATWNTVCILIAGSRLSALKEIAALAGSLFGTEISQTDLQLARDRFVEYGLANCDGENLKIDFDALDTYTQQQGLWAYVRSLRKDFERSER